MRFKRANYNFIRSILEALPRAFVFVVVLGGSLFLFSRHAHAELNFATGSMTKPTSATTQSLTGLPFQPKAVIFYYASSTSQTTNLNTSQVTNDAGYHGLGFAATGITQRSIATWSDTGATSDTGGGNSASDSIVMLGVNGNITGRAQLTQLNSDGFTLNWSVAKTQASIFKYVALGGADITNVKVGSFTLSTSGATQSVTDPGFQPDFVFFLPTERAAGTFNSANTFTPMMYGWAAASTTGMGQAGIALCSEDGEGTAQANRFQSTSNALIGIVLSENTGCNVDSVASVSQMTSQGFDLSVSDLPAANRTVYYLAIKGGAWNASYFSPTGTGEQTVSGAGFAPVGVFFSTFGTSSNPLATSDLVNDDFHFSMGSATTSTGQHGVWGLDDHADTNLDQDALATSTKVILAGVSPNGTANISRGQATFVATTTDGFTVNWTHAAAPYPAVVFWEAGHTLPANTITFSGTLYSDEGSAQVQSAGKSIKLWVGTSTPGIFSTTTVAANGFWQINNISPTGIDAGTRVLAWVDGDSNTRAVTLTKASTTLSTGQTFPNLDLYQNRVIAKYEATSGTTTTNADFAAYDGTSNSSIQYTASGGNLTVNAGQELHVWTGNTFAPGGTVTVAGNAGSGTDGSIHLDTNSTLTLGGDVTLAGSLTKGTGATYTPGSYGTIFNATTTGKTISGTWYGSGQELGSTTFNGSGGAWSFSGSQASTTDLTITNGTLSAPSSGLLTVAGNYSNSGTFTHNGATLYFSGAGKAAAGTMTGTSALGNLTLVSGSASTYSNGFGYCRAMTMTAGGNSGGVATTSTVGFPLVATSTIADLKSVANGGKVQTLSGNYPLDVIFTSGSSCESPGSVIPFYFEDYIQTTGAFTAWMKAPDISSTTQKTVLMYYGKASASDQRSSSGVWSSLAASWDLNEDPSGSAPQIIDLTGHGNDLTSYGSMTSGDSVAFQLANGLNFTSNKYVLGSTPSFVSDTSGTIMTWIKTTSQGTIFGSSNNGSFETLFDFSNGSYGKLGIRIKNTSSDDTFCAVTDPGSPATIDDGKPWLIAITNDSSGKRIFRNDGEQNTDCSGHTKWFGTLLSPVPNNLSLNAYYTAGGPSISSHTLDAVRVYSYALHPMDILTIYNNTRSSDIFWTIGSENQGSSAASYTFSANASTTNLTIGTSATLTAPPLLSVSGNYTNNGTFNQPDGLVEIEGAATYRYVRWNITGIRTVNPGECSGYVCTQFSEFVLLNGGSPVSWPPGTTATNPGGSNPGAETPDKAINGNFASDKMLDFNFGTNGYTILQIDTGSGNTVTFDGYKYATGGDASNRDPITWTVEGSDNGTDWTVLDTRTSETITSSRNTYTSDYTFGAPSSYAVPAITYFSGTNPQTISGVLTASSAFPSLVFTGAGTKAFSANASTTNLTIQSDSGAVTAPNGSLTIAGDFTNNGTFSNPNGVLYIGQITPDGVATWKSRVVDRDIVGTVGAIIYDAEHGKYVAAVDEVDVSQEISVPIVYESQDLVSWTRHAVDSEGDIEDIVYDDENDKYIAVGRRYDVSFDHEIVVWESTDLSSWTPHTLATYGVYSSATSIIYDSTNNKYVVGGYVYSGSSYDAHVWESANLSSWTQRTVANSASSEVIYSLTLNSEGGVYVAGGYVGSTDAVVWESTNLTSWTPHTVVSSLENIINSISYDAANDRYVAAGTFSGDASVAESANLSAWTTHLLNGGGHAYDVLASPDGTTYLAVGDGYSAAWDSDVPVIWTSNDFSTWSEIMLDDTVGQAHTAVYSSSLQKFVVGGNSDYTVATVWDGGISTSTLSGNLAGSSMLGNIIAVGTVTLGSSASSTALTIAPGGELIAGTALSVAGNYSNSGIFTQTTGTTTFNGVSSQVFDGGMIGGSSLYNVVFAGSGAKTFSANASTTNFIIQSDSGTVTLPPGTLTVGGVFNNMGTFAHNDGTLVASGMWRSVPVASNTGEYLYVPYDLAYDSENSKYIVTGSRFSLSSGFTDVVVWDSVDFLSWTSHVVVSGGDEESRYGATVIYDTVNDKYVVGGYDDGVFMVWESTDLSSWTPHQVASNYPWCRAIQKIIYNQTAGKYVLEGGLYNVGQEGCEVTVWDSTDLVSWNTHTVAEGVPSGMLFDSTGGTYLVYGEDYDEYGYVWESTDLSSWTPHLVDNSAVSAFTYNPEEDVYAAVTYDSVLGMLVWESSNLSSWTSHPMGTSYNSTVFLIYDSSKDKYIAVASDNNGNSIFSLESLDLISWQSRSVYETKNMLAFNPTALVSLPERESYAVVGATMHGFYPSDALVYERSEQVFQGNLSGTSALGDIELHGNVSFNTNASTTNLTLATTSVVTLSPLFTVSGNFTNEGGTFSDNTGTTTFNGTSAQTLSGLLIGDYALPNVSFVGAGGKAFGSNASTTNINIAADSGTITNNNILTLNGNFHNSGGPFTNTSGTMYLAGENKTVSGTLTGTSALGNVAVQGGTPSGGTYGNGFGYCRVMTMTAGGNNGGVATTTTVGFPLVATSTIADLKSVANGGKVQTLSGNYPLDVIFTSGSDCDSPGSVIPFYFEDYIQTTGAFTAWMKASDISSTSAKTVLMYYGKASASDQRNKSGVWNTLNIAGKWDLNEDPSGSAPQMADATSNANHGTSNGSMTTGDQVSGMVGGALDFDGSDDELTTATNLGTIPWNHIFSYVLWFKTSTASGHKLMGTENAQTGTGGGSYDKHIMMRSDGKISFGEYDGSVHEAVSTNTLNDGAWHQAVALSNGSSISLYIDGVFQQNTGASAQGYTAYLRMGSYKGNGWPSASDGYYTGLLDDVRVYDTALSPMDILTVYNNTRSSDIFWTIGSENQAPAGGFGTGASYTILNNASTTALTIGNNATLTLPAFLSIFGNYSNAGTFSQSSGTTTLNGTSQQTLSGTMTDTSAFNNLEILNNSGSDPVTSPSVIFSNAASTTGTFTILTPSVKVRFPTGAATSSFNALNLNGQSTDTRIALRSSSAGVPFGIHVGGTQSVSYVDVKDSYACSGTSINAGDGTNLDSTGNSCWTFTVALSASSSANQIFTLDQSATVAATITVIPGSSGVITAANDLRIAIASSTVPIRWDNTVSNATISGSAQGKVLNSVSYEGSDSVVKIAVSEDINAGETLLISGLRLSSFSSVLPPTVVFSLHTGGVADATPDATDTRTVAVAGPFANQNHDGGSASNALDVTTTSVSAVPLYRFKLAPTGESMSIGSLVLRLTGINNFASNEFSNLKLYVDYNGNGAVDAGDTQVGGAGGAVFESGQNGSITFSSNFVATTSRNYVLIGNVANLGFNKSFNIKLRPTDITVVGGTSNVPISLTGSELPQVTHVRIPRGGGSVGDSAPSGAGQQSGGSGSGGQTIGSDPGFLAPSGTGSPSNEWTSPGSAYTSDDTRAISAAGTSQDYASFNFSIPGGNTITGVEVKLEGNSASTGAVTASLSWNGGTNYTNGIASSNWSDSSDAVLTIGGPSNNWGRTWGASEFSNANFRLKLTGSGGGPPRIDAIQVKVYHQAGGGGSGGGGDI